MTAKSESHQQEASHCASADFVGDHEGMDVRDIVSMRLVVVCHHFNTPWSDSAGLGLSTVQDAEPSEDVTLIVDEDAVDERPAGWLVGCDVP